jgi:hypothetical protein
LTNTNPRLHSNTTMADPPNYRTSCPTRPTTTAPPQPDATAVGTEGANTTDMAITATQVNAAPALSTNSAAIGNNSATPNGDAVASTSVSNIALALMPNVAMHQCSTATLTSQQSGAASEEHAAESADGNPSLFAKLPGELRNRIYRAYFEDSARQRKHTMDIRKAASTFLNLFHTDGMIRSEATSIFFKEFLSVDSFFAPENLECAIKSRIKSLCALIAINGMNMPLSITVQESIVAKGYYVREFRSDFVGKLMRFITNETNEWFDRSAISKMPEEGTEPPSDNSMRLDSVVHSSHRYRIKRIHPGAGATRWLGPILLETADQYVHTQQFLGLQGAYQPIRKGADYLRVEGPLTELDWNKFEWSSAGAYKRSLGRARVHRGQGPLNTKES